MGALYQISSSMHTEIVSLDRRWQDRVSDIAREIRSEIHALEIPPPLFKSIVDRNTARLDRIEQRLNHSPP